MKNFRMPISPLFRVIVSCLVFSFVPATFAEVTQLGNPSTPSVSSCDPSSTFIEVELTPTFDIIVRNCGDAAVDMVVVMAHGTPPNSNPPGDPRV